VAAGSPNPVTASTGRSPHPDGPHPIITLAMTFPAEDPANRQLVDLLAQCAKRDQAAFARLYTRTSAKLFGVALRMLKREDWAEDVLQDCYVNIWNHSGSYSAAMATPMTWMISIVRNRSLDWLRRPRLEVSSETDFEDEESVIDRTPTAELGPLELLAQRADARALNDCLGRLEPRQRQAVALAFYEGLTHSELAEHMREPLGTVKTWVRRGLTRLKECLG
jgi:RNA polymerase sigma-70 factor, ECF subfamily